MALKLNGTDGYLEHLASINGGFPLSMAMWVSRDSSANDNWWITQGQGSADRYIAAWSPASSDAKYATQRNPGDSSTLIKNSAPNPSTSLQLAVVVFTSSTTRKVYFGGNTPETSSAFATIDDVASFDRTYAGAWKFNGSAAAGFMNGSLAEMHFFNTALSDAEVEAMRMDSTKPEATTGWVDGWTFEDFEAGGTYLSIGGTRTMTAVGGVTASALAHPISRSSPDATAPGATLIGASTIVGGAASGESPGVAPGATMTGTSTITGGAANGGGSGATLVTYPFVNNTELTDPVLYANQTGVTVHIYSDTDGALVVTKTEQTTNASGIATITDVAMAGATTYRYWAEFNDGEFGADRKTTS